MGGASRLLRLVQCAQAASTYVETLGSLTVSNGYALDVWQPATLCSLFGVAHIVTELRSFPTDITSYWHCGLPLSMNSGNVLQ